jgi:fumarate hydratase class II
LPLCNWQMGSAAPNMNVNEGIGNLVSQLLGPELGSKRSIDPNDHVNLS